MKHRLHASYTLDGGPTRTHEEVIEIPEDFSLGDHEKLTLMAHVADKLADKGQVAVFEITIDPIAAPAT